MRELIREYQKSLKNVRKIKEVAAAEDKKILRGMESDLRYALEWMNKGRMPGPRRGAERLAAYQREKPIDPIHIQTYISRPLYEQQENTVSSQDIERIKDALSCLTKMERDVYVMARGRCIPRSEIAMMMGVEKGTINKILTRSDEKIRKYTRCSISCLPLAT